MAFEIGIRYGYGFAGLVGVSGYVFDLEGLLAAASPVAAQQRFLVTHGSRDPLLPLAQVQPQIQQLQAAGLNIAWHVLDKEHTLAGENELALIRDFIRAGYPTE